jgi:RNA polymerase sigma-70 factor (ECF subfamily)
MEEFSKEIWEGFYNKYSRLFWLYIYKICGDNNMADDIFQESFIKFLRAKPAILNEYHMKSYLYKIAYRLIIDKKRRIKVEKRSFEEEKIRYKGTTSKKQHDSRILLSLDMENTFNALRPRERMLLWLAYIEGYSNNEIAEVTNSKKNSVKVQLFRARKELVNILKKKKYEWGKEL